MGVETSNRRVWERSLPLLLIVVLVLGAWPFLGTLGYAPMTADARLWLERGDPGAEGWAEWTFHTRHFHVGYRPVVALTFTVTQALVGANPWVLRTTDLLVHLAAAVAVAVLARRIAPELPRWTALVAAGLFLVHPVVEEVVAYEARRSYSLATLLTLGVHLLLVGRPRTGWVAIAGAGLLAGLALLTNEVAAVGLVALIPFVVGPTSSLRARVRAALPLLGPLLGAGIALLLRNAVVGGLGGYEIDADGQTDTLGSLRGAAAFALGLPQHTAGGILSAGVIVVVALHAWVAARSGRRSLRRVLLLSAWMGAGVVLFAGMGVWFERLGYVLLPAWALLIAVQLGVATERARGSLACTPLLVGALAMPSILASPCVVGPDETRTEKWSRRQSLIAAMLRVGRETEPPGLVKLVLPYHRFARPDSADPETRRRLPRDARTPFRWVRYRLSKLEETVRLQEFVYVQESGWAWESPTVLGAADGRPAVVAPEGRELFLPGGQRRRPESGEPHVQIIALRPEERHSPCYLFLYRSDGGELVEIPR